MKLCTQRHITYMVYVKHKHIGTWDNATLVEKVHTTYSLWPGYSISVVLNLWYAYH